MSMYGGTPYNEEKNNLFDEVTYFLQDHPVSEMLQIISDAVYRKECEENENQQ